MYKEIPKDKLIDELNSHNINCDITICKKNNKVQKVHKTELDKIDIDNVKSVQFFIKMKDHLHLALFRIKDGKDEGLY